MRVFGPKPPGPYPQPTCPACSRDFKEGDYTTLIPLGPGDSEEARIACKEGRAYNAVAIEVHAACAGV